MGHWGGGGSCVGLLLGSVHSRLVLSHLGWLDHLLCGRFLRLVSTKRQLSESIESVADHRHCGSDFRHTFRNGVHADVPLGFDPSFHCLLAQKASLLRTHFTLVLSLLGILGMGLNWTAWDILLSRPDLDQAQRRAFYFIEHNSPKDSVVLTNEQWAPYFCKRRTMYTPLPVTELERGDPEYRKAAVKALQRPTAMNLKHLTLLGIGRPETFRLPGKILWRDVSGIAVIEILPVESPLLDER